LTSWTPPPRCITKQQLSSARYNYLINQLNIKSALGTLNEQDLLALNNTLGKPVSTSPEASRRKPAAGCRVEKMANGQASQAQPASGAKQRVIRFSRIIVTGALSPRFYVRQRKDPLLSPSASFSPLILYPELLTIPLGPGRQI
jgi:hypothetical protein